MTKTYCPNVILTLKSCSLLPTSRWCRSWIMLLLLSSSQREMSSFSTTLTGFVAKRSTPSTYSIQDYLRHLSVIFYPTINTHLPDFLDQAFSNHELLLPFWRPPTFPWGLSGGHPPSGRWWGTWGEPSLPEICTQHAFKNKNCNLVISSNTYFHKLINIHKRYNVPQIFRSKANN